jgi:MOSC domain-containing protein YiiM
MTVVHLYVSAAHNYVGHFGSPPGTAPVAEVGAVELVAGKGIVGDRYYDHRPDYKGQVTFFALETYERLCAQFGVSGKDPSVFRRNIVTRGADLNALIGEEFAVGGVRFLGTEEAKPCAWMDQAFCPGAREAMAGRGGLRARVLTSGRLERGAGAREG